MDTLNDTPETDKAYDAVIHGGARFSFPEHARRMERQRDAARRERDALRTAIETTINDNLHLADGDNCTLIVLKRALEKETKFGR